MTRILLLGLAVALTLLVSGAWMQAPATGTVKGSVTLNGSALAGAAVVIGSSGSSSYTASATTDPSGNFTFSNTPVGTIEVKVYDANGGYIVGGTGTLKQAGDVISLTLSATN